MADREPFNPSPVPEPDFKGPEQNDGADLAHEILEGDGTPPSQEAREPQPKTPEPQPPPGDQQPPYVTREFIEEREKRQKAEQEVEQWRAWRAEVEKSQQKPAAPPPDPYLQPAEYVEQAIQARMSQALQPITQVMSQMYHRNNFEAAKREFGDEIATAAYQEFDKTALPRAEWESVMGAANPFAAAVLWKRRRDAIAAIGDDPAKFEQTLREKLLADPEFLREARTRAAAATGQFQVAPQPPQVEQPRDEAGRFQPKPAAQIPSVNRVGSAKSVQPSYQALANQSDEDLVDEILSSPSRR
jgi:hypothetical protein